jgi:Tfp pilus assembly protein PilZ
MMSKASRVHERLPISAPIEWEGFEHFHPDRIFNLSAGGVYVVTAKPLPIHRHVSFFFLLPDLPNGRIKASGTVVWSPQSSPGTGARHPMGMGIEFDYSDRELYHLIDQYVTVSTSLRSVDTRIGPELPAHILATLPNQSGIPLTVDMPDNWAL